MGTSGPGSYGKFAEFKAEIINSFVKNNEINSVIEFGCGYVSLLKVPKYIGLDVSKSSIKMCSMKFKEDKTKSFLYMCQSALQAISLYSKRMPPYR